MAALQHGPDGDGSILSGAKALESCAYLAQSMLAHNFRDPNRPDPGFNQFAGPVQADQPTNRFIPPSEDSRPAGQYNKLQQQAQDAGYVPQGSILMGGGAGHGQAEDYYNCHWTQQYHHQQSQQMSQHQVHHHPYHSHVGRMYHDQSSAAHMYHNNNSQHQREVQQSQLI